jgi:hypothetical protein
MEGSLMEYSEAAGKVYKNSFPSDAWLLKYFGHDVIVPGNKHRGEVSTRLYDGLRHLFRGTFGDVKYFLKTMDRTRAEFTPVSVFENGTPAPWVDPELESRGLTLELSEEAFQELCLEFITHFNAGALYAPDEWKWCAEGTSIWIEVIPEALVDGRFRRRKLADILGKHTE